MVKIKNINVRDDLWSVLEGIQLNMRDDNELWGEKYSSLCIIEYFLKNIKTYPAKLRLEEPEMGWLYFLIEVYEDNSYTRGERGESDTEDDPHIACFSYPNCDEAPLGCIAVMGSDVETYGNKD